MTQIRFTIVVMLVFCLTSFAQTFKEDFGTGYDTVAYDWITEGFKPLLTIYHCPPGKPNDGVFVITSNSGQMFQESSCLDRKEGDLLYSGWHQDIKDHTPNDKNGRFLLVNAVSFHNKIYQKTISNLSVDTKYEVSLWLANIFNSGHQNKCHPDSPLDLIIGIYDGDQLIEKNLLVQLKTGRILSQDSVVDLWRNFKSTFHSRSTTITLLIQNISSGGCGNDMAIDDITILPINKRQ